MEELYDAKCREGEVGNTFNESNSHEQLVYFSTRFALTKLNQSVYMEKSLPGLKGDPTLGKG